MFFKMLKSDLKRKKGLNVILFVFISVASVLVFAGAVQIFSNFTNERTAKKLCCASDLLFWSYDPASDTEGKAETIISELEADPNVTDWSKSEITWVNDVNIDYPNYEEDENSYIYSSKRQGIVKQPRKHDLVYDLNDEPFYVPNGCIAIPVEMVPETGVKEGDTVKVTVDTGKVFELKVCRIFKDNLKYPIRRFIVSDADYDVLKPEQIRKYDLYSVRMKDPSESARDRLLNGLNEKDVITLSMYRYGSMNDDYVIMEIISVFVVLISAFLIIIIFMTIRFAMIADLKSEEREIGMMKALGVDSFRFRWLFAAKYIAFAVMGGIIGIAAGLPLAGMVVNMFGPNSILPERYEMILIGILAVVSIIAVMILFSLFVMRRINKITVIDAIHGENRGERFSKGFPMFLHRRKKMSVPLFMALSDILGRFKRYIFLIIAYSLGAAIILLVFNVRNSVVNPHYARYWMYHSYDFGLDLDDEQLEEISKERQSTGKTYPEIINEKLERAGIPAKIETMKNGRATLERNDKETQFFVYWQEGMAEKFGYRKGGSAPKLANEAAMSSYTAGQLDISVGDVLKVKMDENNKDHTGRVTNEREIVITALLDLMEEGDPVLIMGDEFEGAYEYGYRWCGTMINAPEKEWPAVIDQMKDLFGEKQVQTGEEAVRDDLSDYDRLFSLLEYGVGGAVLLVLMLITYLYMNIFVAEEVPESALLKSMGFRNITVKAGYLLRILILIGAALVVAELCMWTLGNALFEMFMGQYDVAGMRFEFEFPVSFIVIPLIIIGAALITTLMTLGSIKHIGIWKISEE